MKQYFSIFIVILFAGCSTASDKEVNIILPLSCSGNIEETLSFCQDSLKKYGEQIRNNKILAVQFHFPSKMDSFNISRSPIKGDWGNIDYMQDIYNPFQEVVLDLAKDAMLSCAKKSEIWVIIDVTHTDDTLDPKIKLKGKVSYEEDKSNDGYKNNEPIILLGDRRYKQILNRDAFDLYIGRITEFNVDPNTPYFIKKRKKEDKITIREETIKEKISRAQNQITDLLAESNRPSSAVIQKVINTIALQNGKQNKVDIYIFSDMEQNYKGYGTENKETLMALTNSIRKNPEQYINKVVKQDYLEKKIKKRIKGTVYGYIQELDLNNTRVYFMYPPIRNIHTEERQNYLAVLENMFRDIFKNTGLIIESNEQ